MSQSDVRVEPYGTPKAGKSIISKFADKLTGSASKKKRQDPVVVIPPALTIASVQPPTGTSQECSSLRMSDSLILTRL